MTIPVRYRTAKEKVIASFSWTDVAAGTGYVTYYFGTMFTGAAVGFSLTETAIYTALAPAGSRKVTIVHNYDTSTFNTPRVVKGTVVFEPDLQSAGGAWTFTLQRVRGADATEIATVTQTIAADGSRTNSTIKATCTETNISRGDFLRIVATPTGDFWLDPNVTSPSRVHIPFKIEL